MTRRDTQVHFAWHGAAATRCNLEIRYTNDPTGRTYWLATTTDWRHVNCPTCQDTPRP